MPCCTEPCMHIGIAMVFILVGMHGSYTQSLCLVHVTSVLLAIVATYIATGHAVLVRSMTNPDYCLKDHSMNIIKMTGKYRFPLPMLYWIYIVNPYLHHCSYFLRHLLTLLNIACSYAVLHNESYSFHIFQPTIKAIILA